MKETRRWKAKLSPKSSLRTRRYLHASITVIFGISDVLADGGTAAPARGQ